MRLRRVEAAATLPVVLDCPTIIATSPSAVRFADAQVALAASRDHAWFAIGKGTASALHRRGVASVVQPAAASDSEALLALPGLIEVSGKRVGLVTAPGGRGLIARELLARGARLEVAEVYRRERVLPSPRRLQALARLPDSTALLFTSEEALAPAWEALGADARAWLSARPCVVASDRLATRARELGFTRVVRAVNAGPPSLLAALRDHAAAASFR